MGSSSKVKTCLCTCLMACHLAAHFNKLKATFDDSIPLPISIMMAIQILALANIFISIIKTMAFLQTSVKLAANIYATQDVNGDGWVDVLTRGKGGADKASIYYSSAMCKIKLLISLSLALITMWSTNQQ